MLADLARRIISLGRKPSVSNPQGPSVPRYETRDGIASETVIPESQIILPLEILVNILRFAGLREIIRCRIVSKHFCTIIDKVPEIQYRVELVVCGLGDGWRSNAESVGLEQNLSLLKSYQNAWKLPRVVFMKLERSAPPLPIRGNPKQHGNPLQVSYHTEVDEVHTKLYFERAEVGIEDISQQRAPIWKRRTLDLDFLFNAYTIDTAYDLLATVSHRHSNGQDFGVVRLSSFTDGKLLPDGLMSILLSPPFQALSMQSRGSVLAIVLDSMYALEVTFINWKHPRIISRFKGRACSTGRFMLVDESTFLLGVYTGDGIDSFCAVEVYQIPRPSHSDSVSPPIPNHLATFHFPVLQNNPYPELQLDYHLTFQPSYPGRAPPFTSPAMLCVGFRSRPVTRVPRSSIVPPGLAFVFMVHLPSLLANIPHITHLDPDERLGPIDFLWNTWGPTSTRYFKVADNDHYTFNQLHFPSNGTHVLLGNLLLDFNQLDIARDISHVLSRQTTGHGTIFKRSPLVNNTSFKQGKAKNIRVPEYPGRIVRCPTVIPRGWMFKEEVITALPYRETSIPTPFKPGSLESFACHTRVASVIPHFKIEGLGSEYYALPVA